MGDHKPIASDSDIRGALRRWLSTNLKDHPTSLVVEELGICQGTTRIDMAVVSSCFEGFEIKSDRDSFRRLRHQIELYSKVLDQATIVVGRRHLDAAKEIVPEWWGILLFDEDCNSLGIKVIRRPKRNRFVDPRALVELLWYDEAIELLDDVSAARGVRGKPRRVVWDRVCEYFKTKEIATKVRAQIIARKGIAAAAAP